MVAAALAGQLRQQAAGCSSGPLRQCSRCMGTMRGAPWFLLGSCCPPPSRMIRWPTRCGRARVPGQSDGSRREGQRSAAQAVHLVTAQGQAHLARQAGAKAKQPPPMRQKDWACAGAMVQHGMHHGCHTPAGQEVRSYPAASDPGTGADGNHLCLRLSLCPAVWSVPGLLHAQRPLQAGPQGHRLCHLQQPGVRWGCY